ncbi:MAG TPA: Gfo/Idh/MocA family oxidoreductase [Planctomycetes bacterium]|nr:Gfo/Idh/MocA family oxidoreductase [Planctomycetota bacterium]
MRLVLWSRSMEERRMSCANATETSTAVRWGVIGLGFFGEVHAETLARMPGIELAALCTRRPDRLAEVADRFGVSRRYTDYRQLLDDPGVHVVSVTTHVDDHCPIAVDALASGKHVLLEKPMAATLADCDRILEAAAGAQGMFMVGHICRFDPRVVLAKQAIQRGQIGRIVSMHARRNLSKTIGRMVLDKISALLGDGIHDADLMLWFTGAKPVHVYAQEVHPGSCRYPDAGWAMFRLDNDAVGVVESVWHLPETTPYQIDARMEVIGTEGALYINCGQAGLEIHGADGARLPDTLYWPKMFGGRFGVLQQELRYFADCVASGRRPDWVTPQESRDAVALIAAAVESAQSGQVVRL